MTQVSAVCLENESQYNAVTRQYLASAARPQRLARRSVNLGLNDHSVDPTWSFMNLLESIPDTHALF